MRVETQIEGLMDAMHMAILSADFQALGQLSPELDAALLALPQKLNEQALLRLQRIAERNAHSAAAAAKGGDTGAGTDTGAAAHTADVRRPQTSRHRS